MTIQDYTDRYCIIGAGASGITAAKNLKQSNIPYDMIEREDDVGGNWYFGKPHSSVYQSTHLLSSKPMTAYTDFPMPDDAPDYLHRTQVLAYLRSYTQHFGIYDDIQFNTSVANCEREEGGYWLVKLDNQEIRRYRGLLICNGHHWDPKIPQFQGQFTGEIIHSSQYKTPNVLHGKRVLVVGGGNSGCDLVVEAVHHAQKVFHSTRRGYYYIPKFVFGKPVDQVDRLNRRLRLPLVVRQFLNMMMIRAILGNPTQYGLPKPDHKLLESHPIPNSLMLYHVGHGDVIPKPNIDRYEGNRVCFVDGSAEEIDMVVYATGFNIRFPFIRNDYLDWQGEGPNLFLHAFHRKYKNLFVVGLLQPNSGIFWLMDIQAQLIARFIHAQEHEPEIAQRFQNIIATQHPDIRGGVKHVSSARHFLEVDYFAYQKYVQRYLRLFPKFTEV